MSYKQQIEEIKKQKEYARQMGILDKMTMNGYNIHLNLYTEFNEQEEEREKEKERMENEINALKTKVNFLLQFKAFADYVLSQRWVTNPSDKLLVLENIRERAEEFVINPKNVRTK